MNVAKAERGDLFVYERHHTYTQLHGPTVERLRYGIGRVRSANKAGTITSYEFAGDVRPRKGRPARCWIVHKDRGINTDAAFNDQPGEFTTLEEAKDFLRRYEETSCN